MISHPCNNISRGVNKVFLQNTGSWHLAKHFIPESCNCSLFVWIEIWVYSEQKIKSGEQTTSKKRNWINKTSLTKVHSLNKWLINLRNGKNVLQFCRTQKSSSSREFMAFFLENYGEKIFPIPYWQFPAWFTWMQYFYLINHFMMVCNQMKKKKSQY